MHMSNGYSSFLKSARHEPPSIAFILGSGLSDVAERVERAIRIPFLEIPELETSAAVAGHKGDLVLGDWATQRVLIFQGRLHYYEGYPWRRVVAPVHIAKELGARILFVTNAAGGIHEALLRGSVMAIKNHLDWTRTGWWRDLATVTSPYSSLLLEKLIQAGCELSMNLHAGVYAQLTGPCYETPAEIRALSICGADAVGMSTAREVQAAHEMELECVGMSLITNRAAGLSSASLHHDEVLTIAARQKEHLADLLEAFLRSL